ncbi:MAG: hypothetical protein CL610_16985 [Anaerolineaceae bacterium]|nr:hypothetical protein [Anaerolineaceae bacterium]
MQDPQDKNRIFISYSRQNSAFAHDAVMYFKSRDIDPWFDLEDIPKGREWWREIQKGISAAKAFVFVISRGSLQSMVCNWELAQAIRQSKKIIPVLFEDVFLDTELLREIRGLEWHDPDGSLVQAKQNWETLKNLNFVRYCDNRVLVHSLEEVITATLTDFDFIENHTRYLVRANEWAQKGKRTAFLLTGDEIREAEQWLSGSQGKDPAPSDLHKAYIQESRRAERTRQRRLRSGIGIALTIMVVLLSLGIWQYQLQQEKSDQSLTNERVAESQRLTNLGNAILNDIDGDSQAAILLGIRALTTAYTAEAEALVREALFTMADTRLFIDAPSEVTCLTTSPDGRYLLRCTQGRGIALYDSESGKLAYEFETPEFSISFAQFSNNSQFLALASEYGTNVMIYDLNDITLVGDYSHTNPVSSVAFSPDSGRLTSSDRNFETIVYDIATKKILSTIRGARYALFMPNGQELIDTENGTSFDPVSGWTVETISPNGLGSHTLTSLAMEGTLLAAFGGSEFSSVIQIWDIETKNQTQVIPVPAFETIQDIALSPDGRFVAAATFEQNVRVWNVEAGELVTQFSNHRSPVTKLAFSADAEYVFSADRDGLVWKWKVEDSSEEQNSAGLLAIVTDEIGQVAISPDGQTLATSTTYLGSGGHDYPVSLWNIESETVVNTLAGHTGLITQIQYATSGDVLVTGSSDNTIRVWSTLTGEELSRFDGSGHIALSPDNQHVVIANDETLEVWNWATNHLVTRPQETRDNAGRISGLALSHQGTRVLLNAAFYAYLWDLENMTKIKDFTWFAPSAYDVSYSPNDRQAAMAMNDGTVVIRDADSGNKLTEFTAHPNSTSLLRFSPDGAYIATAGQDGSIRLWDSQNYTEIRRLELDIVSTADLIRRSNNGERAASGIKVNDFAFTPDGSAIISSHADRSLRLWSLNTANIILQACQRITRDFTVSERASFGIRDDNPTCFD